MNRSEVEDNKAIEKFIRLTGIKTMKQHFNKVAVTISNYIDQAEAFIARLAKYIKTICPAVNLHTYLNGHIGLGK